MAEAKNQPKLKKELKGDAWPKSRDPFEVPKSGRSRAFPISTQDNQKPNDRKKLPRA